MISSLVTKNCSKFESNCFQVQENSIGLHIKKAPGIVPVMDDFYIKWNEILKGTEGKLIELLLVKSEKVVAKIQLKVDSSINSNYPEKC